MDIAVLLAPGADAWNLRLELGADLSEALGQEVDLVVMGEDLDLTFRVLREGRRLYARDHDRVCSEEATLASMYYDFEPFLTSYLAGVAERFGRG